VPPRESIHVQSQVLKNSRGRALPIELYIQIKEVRKRIKGTESKHVKFKCDVSKDEESMKHMLMPLLCHTLEMKSETNSLTPLASSEPHM
jgi:hypothetical protein